MVQELDVLLAIDRAGMVGNDGKTHVGAFDLSYLRCLPGVVIMAPSDENECRKMLTTGFLHEGPAAVRYPRGKGPGAEVEKTLEPIPDRQGTEGSRGERDRVSGVRQLVGSGGSGRGGTGRDAGRHAFRQASGHRMPE